MEDKYGIEHEKEFLAAFDQVMANFEKSKVAASASAPENKDISGNESFAADAPEYPETEDIYSFNEPEISDYEPEAEKEPGFFAGIFAGKKGKKKSKKSAESADSAEYGEVPEASETAENAATDAPEQSSDNSAAAAIWAAPIAAGAGLAEAAGGEFESAEAGDIAEMEDSKESKKSGKNKKEKKNKKTKKKRSKAARVLLTILLICVIVGILGCGAVGYYVYTIVKGTPEINPSNIYSLISQNSVMLDANGDFITNIYLQNNLRTNLDYDELPPDLVNAFVCIEDKTFWEHDGFNYIRIMGAIWDSAKTGFKKKIGGTSTITQQLARNIYLSEIKSKRSIERKIQEAYYTIVIEHTLSKKQIVEAYLNTIYLGYNAYGVQAAANAYFNKDAKDLSLIECAVLASLPQSPAAYAPLKRIQTSKVTDYSDIDVVSASNEWVVYYNKGGEDRVKLVLRFMHEQGKIDDSTYEWAKQQTARAYVNPGNNVTSVANTSYFKDYVIAQVIADLQAELGYTYKEAYNLLYTGGLVINSTFDPVVQNILEEEYDNPENFPKIALDNKLVTTDKDKNIVNDTKTRVIMYNKDKYFAENGDFVLNPDEFKWLSNGNLMIYTGKRLNIYNTKSAMGYDVSVEFKYIYEYVEDQLYARAGGVWNIDTKYKTRDDDKNLIIDAQYFKDFPNAFTKNSDGTMTLSADYFDLKPLLLQPQSAMVIIETSTGRIRAMIGGRGITGSLLYNRATATRQTGSSIKPLSVYSYAIQTGYEAAKEKIAKGSTTKPLFTAGTPVEDSPMNLGNILWPSNVDNKYRGVVSLRYALEHSINACAVSLYLQFDPAQLIRQLQSLGISSLVTTGAYNDINASALALGGMCNGVSPLEMCSAYQTIGNYGVHIEKSCYTTVTDRKGNIILEKNPESNKVYDEEVASLMLDMLRTAVQNVSTPAKLVSQPSAGKTGTTSDQYDLWFCGFTPKYTATTWIGCDTNTQIGTGSKAASTLWAKVMERVGALDPKGTFEYKGKFVTRNIDKHSGMLVSEHTAEEDIVSEIFIQGTEPKELDDSTVQVVVCMQSGYLATPSCPRTGYKTCYRRPGGVSWEAMVASYNLKGKNATYRTLIQDSVNDIPDYYCPIHNPDKKVYPVSPLVNKDTQYTPQEGVEEIVEDGYELVQVPIYNEKGEIIGYETKKVKKSEGGGQDDPGQSGNQDDNPGQGGNHNDDPGQGGNHNDDPGQGGGAGEGGEN